jgi:hypothetical protein
MAPGEFDADASAAGGRSPVSVATPPEGQIACRLEDVAVGAVDHDPTWLRAPTSDRGRTPTPAQALPSAMGFVAPLLVLLAALSTLEGYLWLNVISADGWRSWAVGLAVLTFGAAIALIRPLRRGRRLAATLVVSVSVAMLGATVVAVFVNSTAAARTTGVADLLFALTALGAVAAAAHSARRPH